MKELSIEEKAKRYDEAIEKFDVILNLNTVKESGTIFADDVRKILPELAESDDERIRKALIDFFSEPGRKEYILNGFTVDDILAWLEKQGEHKKFRDSIQVGDKVTRNEDGVLVNLSQLNRVAKKDEKQGEQKPAWSEEDEIALGDALWCCKQAASIAKGENDMGNVWYAERWLKSLKGRVQPQPKQKWSKEDSVMINKLLAVVDLYYGRSGNNLDKQSCISFLKSLKPHSTWKPSEEQMDMLAKVCSTLHLTTGENEIMESIYDALKKLK